MFVFIKTSTILGAASLLLAYNFLDPGIQTAPCLHLIPSSTRGALLDTSYYLPQWIQQKPAPMPLRHWVGRWHKMVRVAAKKAKISPCLVAAVLHVENHGDIAGSAERVSPAGAIGPMQLMPNTAWNFLRVNPWNPSQNIQGGARYLAYLMHIFHDRLRLAIMAYNAGPTAIANHFYPQQSITYANQVLRIYHEQV